MKTRCAKLPTNRNPNVCQGSEIPGYHNFPTNWRSVTLEYSLGFCRRGYGELNTDMWEPDLVTEVNCRGGR